MADADTRAFRVTPVLPPLSMSYRTGPSPDSSQYPLMVPDVASPGAAYHAPAAPSIAADVDDEGVPWSRYADALKRHWLLVVAMTVLGSSAGVIATRLVKPLYDAQATVWINSGGSQQAGPIRAQQLLPSTSWAELLRSFAIVDPVVRQLHLNVEPANPADAALFEGFATSAALRPGDYTLVVDGRGRRYQLRTKGIMVESGALADSIGRRVGFLWQPGDRLLTPGRTVDFTVTTPRATSVSLLSRVQISMPENSQFLTITLSGTDPQRTARTVNAWAQQFVQSSTDLKKRHLVEFRQTLADQLALGERQLHSAEIQLEQFRVNTITLPSDKTPLAGGVQATRDPVFTAFFQQKAALDEVRSDRMALERMLAEAHGGPLNTQAFLLLPSILNNTPQLRSAIEELSTRQTALRTEQQYLTDANPRIKQLAEAVRTLEYETIPQIARSALASLQLRERDLASRIDTQSEELRSIPSRTIEEMRLLRQVSASENLYNSLKGRFEEVSLSEAETTPDMNVLDYAVAPVRPSANDAPRLLALAVLASLGIAVGIALLHDRMDNRFRYPEQATKTLGLTIAGVAPMLRNGKRRGSDLAALSQTVEAFRTMRLSVRFDTPRDAPVMLSVTSPGAGDGKSHVSSNLALAFASAGERTLLIDGDLRCGKLHSMFGLPSAPGLVEYLEGVCGDEAIVKSTATNNLFVLPCGKRHSRSPELLVTARMRALIDRMRERFDVVIVDCPPFIAGMDAFALGTATGNMLIVLRQGLTDVKLAEAKLSIVDRLPITVLGAVLNGVPAGGAYKYYGSDYAYHGKTGRMALSDVTTPTSLVLRA